ncbi:hypothetical protein [Ruminococcus flavefaciens]|uniref:hypothetical protein n=1 Tax=Ruminococcus flavefaciens TaxID=1265 RepID=UPI000377A58A|nr:hypothetical protein [Ruminococcus flavefaciens]
MIEYAGFAHEAVLESLKGFVGKAFAVAVDVVITEYHRKDVYLVPGEFSSREPVYLIKSYFIHDFSFRIICRGGGTPPLQDFRRFPP